MNIERARLAGDIIGHSKSLFSNVYESYQYSKRVLIAKGRKMMFLPSQLSFDFL